MLFKRKKIKENFPPFLAINGKERVGFIQPFLKLNGQKRAGFIPLEYGIKKKF